MRQYSILNNIATSLFIFAPKSVTLILAVLLMTDRAKRIVQLSNSGDL